MYNNSTRSTAPRQGNPLLTGILIGVVAGLLIAGGVALYIFKTPNSFVKNVPREKVELEPDHKMQAATSAPADASDLSVVASSVSDGKPRFEFYKVLTEKQDTPTAAPSNGSATAPAASGKPVVTTQAANNQPTKEAYVLQAGSFPNAKDANELKAKLALIGIEASVQAATLPGKGVWHRVQVGPYRNKEEMNNTLAILRKNKLNPTPMLAQ